MPNLRSALNDLASHFAESVRAAIRGASIQDLLAETGGSKRARSSARSVRSGAGGHIPTPFGKKTRGGRLARRTPADIAKALDAVVAHVRKTKTGLRSEEIRKSLKLDVREVPRILKQGLATKKLRSRGQKRATTYFAG